MDPQTIAKLYTVDGPFTTIYLDATSAVEDAAKQLDVRWKNVLRELDGTLDATTLDRLTAARGDHTRGNTRVLVATHSEVRLAISLPQPPAQELVTTATLPRLTPLLEALDGHLPHVLVLADRTGADILAYTAGPDPAETGSVTNDRFPSRKVRPGGWAEKRFSNDVEETWEQSARDVAALVDRVATNVDAQLIIASGDERALKLLANHLPATRTDRFVTIAGGGRHDDGSESVIADEVFRVLGEAADGRMIDLLEKYAEERSQRDRGSDGVAETIEALRKGQVETLVLADSRDRDATAWVGPDPSHLALAEQDLRDLGVDTPQQALLEDALVRAALGTGAAVRFVTGGTEQAPRDGVGALLRYAD
jgi:hypothetical protein